MHRHVAAERRAEGRKLGEAARIVEMELPLAVASTAQMEDAR
ncbi:MAG: hypothetical protein V8T46_08525 [Sutterella seckii]